MGFFGGNSYGGREKALEEMRRAKSGDVEGVGKEVLGKGKEVLGDVKEKVLK